MIQISIVQILRKDSLDYQKILNSNKAFFDSVDSDKDKKLEYIIYDCLSTLEVVPIMRNFPDIKYIRKNFSNVKNCFLESIPFTSGEKIIFLKSDDVLNINNVQKLETIRPNILRKDVEKIKSLKQENFSYDDFNLLIKDKKTFFEKLKLMFS